MSKKASKKKARHYGEKEKTAKLAWYESLRCEGRTRADAAKMVGVPLDMVQGWINMANYKRTVQPYLDARKKEREATENVPVPAFDVPLKTLHLRDPGLGTALDAIHKLSGPCLVLKNGYRVYGPVEDLITAVKLLEA
jgi:hypothetical protein